MALTGVTVDAMLGQAEGLFDFDAALTIAQNTDAEYPTQLTVISQLEGMTLDAPAPCQDRRRAARFQTRHGF
jgi:uncharacterized protein YhdP